MSRSDPETDLVLFPRRHPRLILPSAVTRRATAFDFYRPTTIRGRLGRGLLQYVLVHSRGTWLTANQASTVAHYSNPLAISCDLLRDVVPKADLAYFDGWTGAPGPQRKIVVAARDARGNALAYVKTNAVRFSTAVHRLAYETKVLYQLDRAEIITTPRVLAYHEHGGFASLAVTALNGVHFRNDAPLDPWRLQFLTRLKGWSGVLDCTEASRLLSDRSVRLTLAHGDFTPWNCVLMPGNRLAVFDWEFCGLRPAGWDACHHEIQSASYFSSGYHRVVPRLRSRLVKALSQVLSPDDGPPLAAVERYCSMSMRSDPALPALTRRGLRLRKLLLQAI